MIERSQKAVANIGLRKTLASLIAIPQISGRAVLGDVCVRTGELIDFNDVIAVGRIREFESKHLGIRPRLLHGIGGGLVNRLRLDDRQRKVTRVPQQIIDALWWLP